jgi:hypothetical protein
MNNGGKISWRLASTHFSNAPHALTPCSDVFPPTMSTTAPTPLYDEFGPIPGPPKGSPPPSKKQRTSAPPPPLAHSSSPPVKGAKQPKQPKKPRAPRKPKMSPEEKEAKKLQARAQKAQEKARQMELKAKEATEVLEALNAGTSVRTSSPASLPVPVSVSVPATLPAPLPATGVRVKPEPEDVIDLDDGDDGDTSSVPPLTATIPSPRVTPNLSTLATFLKSTAPSFPPVVNTFTTTTTQGSESRVIVPSAPLAPTKKRTRSPSPAPAPAPSPAPAPKTAPKPVSKTVVAKLATKPSPPPAKVKATPTPKPSSSPMTKIKPLVVTDADLASMSLDDQAKHLFEMINEVSYERTKLVATLNELANDFVACQDRYKTETYKLENLRREHEAVLDAMMSNAKQRLSSMPEVFHMPISPSASAASVSSNNFQVDVDADADADDVDVPYVPYDPLAPARGPARAPARAPMDSVESLE